MDYIFLLDVRFGRIEMYQNIFYIENITLKCRREPPPPRFYLSRSQTTVAMKSAFVTIDALDAPRLWHVHCKIKGFCVGVMIFVHSCDVNCMLSIAKSLRSSAQDGTVVIKIFYLNGNGTCGCFSWVI